MDAAEAPWPRCRRRGAPPASIRPLAWPPQFAGGCVLKDGEAFDSPRARAQAGPHATIALHNLVEVEEFGNMGRSVPPPLAHAGSSATSRL